MQDMQRAGVDFLCIAGEVFAGEGGQAAEQVYCGRGVRTRVSSGVHAEESVRGGREDLPG